MYFDRWCDWLFSPVPIYGKCWRFGFSLACIILNQQLRIVETGRNRRYLKCIYRNTDNATASLLRWNYGRLHHSLCFFGYRWNTSMQVWISGALYHSLCFWDYCFKIVRIFLFLRAYLLESDCVIYFYKLYGLCVRSLVNRINCVRSNKRFSSQKHLMIGLLPWRQLRLVALWLWRCWITT
jgi:hypothetical protein